MTKILIFLPLLCVFSRIYPQSVDFTFQGTNGLFCTPSTIQFTQTSTGNPTGFEWDFGNGQKGYTGNVSSTYTAPGTYTVKLTAIFDNTILYISKQIVIHAPIKASIAVDRGYICLPGVINFTGSGNGSISNYEWNFGDGTPPVNTPSAKTGHAFADFGTDTVTLRATDAFGCYGDTNIVVSIKFLPITADMTPTSGCIPTNIAFSSDVDIPLNSTVSNYTWDFGDGSPPSVSLSDSINHTYSVTGIYFPILTITTSEGCARNYDFPPVAVGVPPDTAVAYTKKPVICGSESALFVAHGTNADRFFWNFGDGTTLSTTDTIVAHKYTTLGAKSVGVSAYYNGCPGAFARTMVDVTGVIAQYSAVNNCISKNTYQFTNASQGNVSGSLWDFGDGFQQPNTNNPVHPYPLSGQFLSSLIVNDNTTGCADTVTRNIYTAVPVLTGTATAVCKNDSVTFSIANNYTDTSLVYHWYLLGLKIANDSNTVTTVKATTAGSYNNFVVIDRGPQLCMDTVWSASPVIVKGPQPDFNFPSNICFNTPVTITNNSQPFLAADTIRLWNWDYGNSSQNDTMYQPPAYQYATPGTYNIILTAIDKNGCKDTLGKIINIDPLPALRIIPGTHFICAGQPVTIIALNDDKLVWSPGNGLSCINCDTTIATPAVSTKYYATATNNYNCSIRDSIDIEVQVPFTATPSSGNMSICRNETATLDAMPKGKKILWSPAGELSDPAVYNPIATPPQSITYTATLTDSADCFSSNTSFDVYVKSLPQVDAGPDKFYPRGTSFTLAPTYSSNVNTYSWTPAASLSCSNCAIPNGVANNRQTYTVKVTSDSGCVASDSVTISTECKDSDLYMAKAFTPNNDGRNDFFYPMTKSFKSIASFIIYNRQGRVLYSASNFPPNDKFFGWDGKFEGKDQSAGTYVFSLEAVCEIGKRVFRNGSFILIR